MPSQESLNCLNPEYLDLDRTVPRWDDDEMAAYASLDAPFDGLRLSDEEGQLRVYTTLRTIVPNTGCTRF